MNAIREQSRLPLPPAARGEPLSGSGEKTLYLQIVRYKQRPRESPCTDPRSGPGGGGADTGTRRRVNGAPGTLPFQDWGPLVAAGFSAQLMPRPSAAKHHGPVVELVWLWKILVRAWKGDHEETPNCVSGSNRPSQTKTEKDA